MKITDFKQLYMIWVNGVMKNKHENQYPLFSNIKIEWTDDLEKAVSDYKNAVAIQENYDQYIVTLFSVEIEPKKFAKRWGVKFNLSDERTQDAIGYEVDFKFNTVAERCVNF